MLDTGIQALPDFAGRMVDGVDLSGGNNPWQDSYGHGTFVAGLIAGNGAASGGQYTGEAPGAGLVSVKVAGASGQTQLSTVIQGVGWTIANEAKDDIRVLNMSLGYLPVGSTSARPARPGGREGLGVRRHRGHVGRELGAGQRHDHLAG